jgi:hypothetical protein
VLYRVVGFLLGFGVVLGIVLLAAHPRRLPALSESAGVIRTVEIQYTHQAALQTWPTIEAFLKALDPEVRVIAVCASDEDATEFRQRTRSLKLAQLETLVVGGPITGWSKDRFLVAAGGRLLCPKNPASLLPARTNDAQVARRLAARWPKEFACADTDLSFDSGDILCTDRFALVNDEIPTKNPLAPDWLPEVETFTGKRVLWLKGTPAHHIGMFAAPLDDKTVMVGDPDLGAKLWSGVLGQADMSKEATEPFRVAIRELEAAGFRVVRTPLVVLEPKVYVTYTNAVIEHRGARTIVYMPSYDVPALDQAAADAYRSQGCEVRPIPVRSVFRLCGTIGCLVNVLERS